MSGESLMLGDALIAENLITAEQLTEALLTQEEERNRKGQVLRPLGDIVHEQFNIKLDDIESVFVNRCLPDIIKSEILSSIEGDHLLEMEEIDFSRLIAEITVHVPHYYRQKTDLDRMDNVEGKMIYKHRKCLEYMISGKVNCALRLTTQSDLQTSFFFSYKMIEKEFTFNRETLMEAIRDPLVHAHASLEQHNP
jgi:hypothetical protein